MALFVLANLCAQFSDVLVKEYFAVWGYRLPRSEYANAMAIGACLCSLIGLLGYVFLEAGYFTLSDSKRTRPVAIWGMVAARLGFIMSLLFLARYVLFGVGGQENGGQGDFLMRGLAYFVIVLHVAFCVSLFLLRRFLLGKPILRCMCLVGVLGWLLSLLLNTVFIFDFSHDIVFRWFDRGNYSAVYFGAWHVADALLFLSFMAFVFIGKDALLLADGDYEDTEEWNCGSSERRVDWSKCMLPLLVLTLIAVPLCVVPFCMRYPYSSNSLIKLGSRNNVLIFKVLCALIGGSLAIRTLRTLWPFLKSLNSSRVFRSMREGLGTFRKSVSDADRVPAATQTEDASVRERLLEIRQLLDEGLLTQAEYEQKRAGILSTL